jgi:glycosyltransferase involved in cell wall biosynthesis
MMEMKSKRTVAVFYPAFMGGGAEAVGLWILEALKETYDLTLFTLAEIDLAQLNLMYGTNLSPASVRVQSLFSAYFRSACYFLVANSPNLRMVLFHWLIRYLKAQSYNYDLVLSGYNAADLGKPGMQYIHWVNVLEGKAFHQRISQFSQESLRKNYSIANSQYVADRVQQFYGISSKVIFPPVVMRECNIPWEDKENAFICSGRLTIAKQPHKIIQILKQVRQQGFDLKLYLTGGGGGIYAWKYQRFLKQMIRENSDWVTLYENLSYEDYIGVVSRCKYGIHYKEEPFGISIAEMVKAGAIPFVRNKGGQVEIVGEQPELFFNNDQEAIDQIVKLLSQPEREAEIRQALQLQKQLFSTEQFMRDIQIVVQTLV